MLVSWSLSRWLDVRLHRERIAGRWPRPIAPHYAWTVGAVQRTRKGWGLAAFLTGLVGLFVGDFVVSVLHVNPDTAVYLGLVIAVGVVAVLTIWLNPTAPR